MSGTTSVKRSRREKPLPSGNSIATTRNSRHLHRADNVDKKSAVIFVQQKLGITERRACAALGQSHGLQRRKPVRADDEEALTADITRLARHYGRYGYKRITALLHREGWVVNHKRVERIWRQEALKVPARHKKRGRLYLNDGSCILLRPCWPNHVWTYDFVAERLKDGTKIRTPTVIDEYMDSGEH